MKVKQRSDDFRVRELLSPDVLGPRGEFRVYRVIKSKHTSFEAARVLASEAGANAGDVSMCGLKDRQGVTLQHMAVRHGPEVSIRSSDLRIETAGFTSEPLDSKASEGNAFEIVLRGLTKEDVETLRGNSHALRDRGLINYFDDQRFGNLRHGQGWIALQLMRGEHEEALKALLTSRSPHDDRKAMAFKRALTSYWGDWNSCRDIAGKFGEHHSLFEHLKHSPQDFAGAFYHLASRLRLIHLYAYQSHLWNRAVADFVRARVEPSKRVVLTSEEGPLVYPESDIDLGLDEAATFRLPGPKLGDVKDREHFELLADALAHDQLVPAQFVIEGVSGFAIKGEDRPLFVVPRHLRLRPARADVLNQGALQVEVRFELPRGAYATLVVRRLLETSAKHSKVSAPRELSRAPQAPRRPDPDADLLANVRPKSGAVSAKRGRGRPGRDDRAPRGPRNTDGPRNFDGPRDTDGPRRFDGPRSPERPRKFDGPRRFDGPPRREGDGGAAERRPPRREFDRGPADRGAPRERPNDGPRREYAPRAYGPRDSGPRDAGPRERGGGRGGPRQGGPRDSGPREDRAPRPSGGPKPLANWTPKPRSDRGPRKPRSQDE